jgi:hypothetical protein
MVFKGAGCGGCFAESVWDRLLGDDEMGKGEGGTKRGQGEARERNGGEEELRTQWDRNRDECEVRRTREENEKTGTVRRCYLSAMGSERDTDEG